MNLVHDLPVMSAIARVRVTLRTDGQMFEVWLVDGDKLAGSRWPGHRDADYIAGFLNADARERWVKEKGMEVVND